MTRHHQPTRRVNPKPSLIPAPLEPGKARCAGCSAVVSVTPNGRLRKHRAPSGEDCAYTVGLVAVHLDELPAVVVPEPKGGSLPKQRPALVTVESDARLAPKGLCKDCGRWLPGERSLCGRCANRRNASGAACWWLLASPALIIAVAYVGYVAGLGVAR